MSESGESDKPITPHIYPNEKQNMFVGGILELMAHLCSSPLPMYGRSVCIGYISTVP